MISKILLQLKYRLIYIVISITIVILIQINLRYLILAPLYFYFLLKTQRKIIKYCIIFIIVYVSLIINFSCKEIKTSSQYNVRVSKVTISNDSYGFEGKVKTQVVKVYLSDEELVKPGELYSVKGELATPINNTVPKSFNYKNYLKSKKIKYIIFASTIEKKQSRFSMNTLSYEIERYIDDNIPLSKSYVKTFILADKGDFDQITITSVNKLGISHLFAVSGLHVGLLVIALTFLFRKMKISNLKIELMIIIVLLLYLIVTSFAPSISRAVLMYVMIVINRRLGLNISSVDILSIVFLILIIFNPYYYYNVGFVLSFVVTFSLVLGSTILGRESGIKQLFLVGVLSFICTVPIVINLNNQINLLTLFFNVLFIIYMSYIILPLAYITFLAPCLDMITFVFIKVYNELIYTMTRLDFLIIHGSFVNCFNIIVYYIIIIFILISIERRTVKKKLLLLLIVFIFLVVNSHQLRPYKQVVFLDVSGDATLITDSYNQCNILIDTGDEDDYNVVIDYLQSYNIRRLDYLIISHFHSDHSGEAKDIVESISVKKVISSNNVGEFDNMVIECGTLELFIYEMSYDDYNENNNSIILSLFIANRHYLFTGDSEKERETEFLDKYDIDVDYIKVAHHGSITSSTESFIDSIKPEEAVIMVKRNNFHNHPSRDIVDRYTNRDIVLYRTDVMGSIEITYFLNYERKKYYLP